MNVSLIRMGKNGLRVEGLARARSRAGLMLCLLILVCSWVRAGVREEQVKEARRCSARVIYDDEKKTAIVAVSGGKILDRDLKGIRMPPETEMFCICNAATSLISREGLGEVLSGLPLKELSLSCYGEGNMGYLRAIEDLPTLRKVRLNLNRLSEAWVAALGEVQRTHAGDLELTVSVFDGEPISLEVLRQMDGLAAFTTIRFSARMNEETLVQLAKEQAGKLKRVSVMTEEAIRELLNPSPKNKP
jgi:hypothetical protein